MDKIEIDEYVRTNIGTIGKLIEIKTVQPKMYGKYDLAYKLDICERFWLTENNIVKHSKNIVDLIKAGDVLEIYFPIKKAILTKEQYEHNCYNVEE